MARVRSRDTRLELQFRRALWRCGYRYRLYADLPGTPDLVFPGKKVAVFIDSCFWHGCPKHYRAPNSNRDYWRNKLHNNRTRDKRVNRQLRKAGWTVVRVWEHQVRRDLESCIARVSKALAKAP